MDERKTDDRRIATEIIDRQIKSLQEEIIDKKVEIADTFLRIDDSMNDGELIPKDISAVFKDMSNLRKTINLVRASEAKLGILSKSKCDVEKTYLEDLIKV